MDDDENIDDPFTKPKLHTSAMEEGIWLGNLFKRELMPEPEQKYVEYTEGDIVAAEHIKEQWREANKELVTLWKPDVERELSAAEALKKARDNMTGRFNLNNPQPSYPGQPNRMRSPNRLSLNRDPVFDTSPAVQAYNPEYYSSATTHWKRISPVAFESLVYKRSIVRAPDFDRPHEDATLAVMHLSDGTRLAIRIQALDSDGVTVQRLHTITRSNVKLSGRIGLNAYAHPSGLTSLDLIIHTPTGVHTIARTHTEIHDWVLGFYKEDR